VLSFGDTCGTREAAHSTGLLFAGCRGFTSSQKASR
jgi:hypothetical protein